MTRRSFMLQLVIFAVTFLTFSRLISCDFSWWDDQETISENPRLNPPTLKTLEFYWTTGEEHLTMGLYVPVTYTFWSGLALLAHRDLPDHNGLTLNAWVFHGANVLLHSLTAILVFRLLKRLLHHEISAAIGALFFALHPVQVESVGWISGGKDLLCGFFSTASLLLFVRSIQIKTDEKGDQRSSRWSYAWGTLCFATAMLSKPTGVVVPLMAGVISWLVLDRSFRRSARDLWPWGVLMIPCLIWTRHAQPTSWSSSLPVWARPAVAADALAFYLHKLVWVAHLCIDYGRNPDAIVADHSIYYTWLLPAAVVALLWWKFKTLRPVVAAAILFVLPLVPLLGFLPFEFQLISTTSDHYLYMPMIGAGLLLGWGMTRGRIPMWSVIALLLVMAIRCVLQEPVWQNTRTLHLHALSINPRSVASMDGLGYFAGREARDSEKKGQLERARTLFHESTQWYEKALVLDPNSVPSLYNVALNYQKLGQKDVALDQIHRIVAAQRLLPTGLQVDPMRQAELLSNFGDVEGAIKMLESILANDPTNTEANLRRNQAISHLKSSATQP